MIDSAQAADKVIAATATACDEINAFSRRVFKTRGGRIGSGMGTLLEALWGYYVNKQLLADDNSECEIAWLSDHEYNDFACVRFDQLWDAASRAGELLRIEAKSMNADADESKGHFDQLLGNLGLHDLLLVLIWRWREVDSTRVCLEIEGHFIGPARPIATLRDQLHIARGGTFVDRISCPDGCSPADCTHHREPLNASGNRERRTGPATCRGAKVDYAANFGGLRRMLYTRSADARAVLRRVRREDDIAHQYISLVHRSFPRQEASQYSSDDWRAVASSLGLTPQRTSKEQLVDAVRAVPGYMEALRALP